MYNSLFTYLKDNNIKHDFNERTNEVVINRDALNNDFRTFVVGIGFNIFELDTIIVVF